MTPRPLSFYAQAVRPSLPAHAFSAVPTRLVWLAAHVSIVVIGIWALAHGWGGLWAAPLWSLLIGQSFAGGAFVGHETMHGAVVRGRRLRHVVGWLSFLPFTLSPRLWVAWHNKVHHGNTMIDGVDPDAFPTMSQFRRSRTTRIADFFALADGHHAGFLTLLFGFTGQSTQMLLRWAPTTDVLDARERRLIWLETLAGVTVWSTVAVLVGAKLFLFAFVLPLLVGNSIVISYILTNHSLSPLNDVNDPLLNSLTVEVPWLVNKLHLNFGLHVEHHLFPSMSSAYAPFVRDALRAQFAERYQSMPLLRAMHALMTSPRVYGSPTMLVDPHTGRQVPTLLPRGEAPPDAVSITPSVAAEPTGESALPVSSPGIAPFPMA